MRPTATDRQIQTLIDAGHADIDDARELWPLIREHRSRRPGHTGADWPEVEDGDGPALLGFLKALDDLHQAADALRARLPELAKRMAPRRCRMCTTSGGPFRHGLCDRHRKRWERAGRPDLEHFIAGSAVPPESTDVPPVAPELVQRALTALDGLPDAEQTVDTPATDAA